MTRFARPVGAPFDRDGEALDDRVDFGGHDRHPGAAPDKALGLASSHRPAPDHQAWLTSHHQADRIVVDGQRRSGRRLGWLRLAEHPLCQRGVGVVAVPGRGSKDHTVWSR